MAEPSWSRNLSDRLRSATRVAVLGVGSDLRGDDIAGMLVAERLQTETSPQRHREDPNCSLLTAHFPTSPPFAVFLGGTAPENCTGGIRRFQPSHLVIVDAADLGEKPGTIHVFAPDQIAGAAVSTHTLPLKVIVEYLAQDMRFEAVLIGIQPLHLEYDRPPSPEVLAAVNEVSHLCLEILTARSPVLEGNAPSSPAPAKRTDSKVPT